MSKNYYKTIEPECALETKHSRTRSDAASSFLRYKSHAIIPAPHLKRASLLRPSQDQVSRFCSSAIAVDGVKPRDKGASIEKRLSNMASGIFKPSMELHN